MERQIKDYCGKNHKKDVSFRIESHLVDLLITGSRVYNVMLSKRQKLFMWDYLLKEEDLKKYRIIY